MRLLRDPVGRWLLSAALSVPVCLGVWWGWLREPLIAALAQAVGRVSPWLWPDAVLGIGLQNQVGLIITLLPPLTDPPRLFMALPLSFNRAVVIFPLFWGLTLATPGRGLLRRLLLGTALLLPVAFGMTLLYAQFQLMLYRTHLPMLTETPPTDFALALPDAPLAVYLWGLGRQLAVLVLPVVAPLGVWLGFHGAFLRTVRLGGLLQHRTPPTALLPTTPRDPSADA